MKAVFCNEYSSSFSIGIKGRARIQAATAANEGLQGLIPALVPSSVPQRPRVFADQLAAHGPFRCCSDQISIWVSRAALGTTTRDLSIADQSIQSPPSSILFDGVEHSRQKVVNGVATPIFLQVVPGDANSAKGSSDGVRPAARLSRWPC